MLRLVGFLRNVEHNGLATMLDSPYHAYNQVKFTIGEEGRHDLENKYSKAVAASSECGW